MALTNIMNTQLDELKKESLFQFSQSGFPTRSEEAWKYTDLKFLKDYVPNVDVIDETIEDSFIQKLPSLQMKAIRLIFINGQLQKIQNLEENPEAKDIIVTTLSEAFSHYPEKITPFLLKNFSETTDRFIHLNTAFLQEGLFLCFPKNTVLKTPIHLLFITKNASTQTIYHPRNIFIMEENSSAVIFEEHISMDEMAYCKNIVTQINIKKKASLDYYKLQNENKNTTHIATTKINQQNDSQVCSNTISVGGSVSRDDLTISLNEPGASCQLNGLSFGKGQQHIDHHTRVDHFAPQTSSDQYYKNILDGASTGVFNGKIIVHPNAVNTKSQQRNKNLLLSNSAEINTKPELEIYADEVQCSHGATVGQLDENALFYLRSRGLPETLAVSMLTAAFAEEILERMGNREISLVSKNFYLDRVFS